MGEGSWKQAFDSLLNCTLTSGILDLTLHPIWTGSNNANQICQWLRCNIRKSPPVESIGNLRKIFENFKFWIIFQIFQIRSVPNKLPWICGYLLKIIRFCWFSSLIFLSFPSFLFNSIHNIYIMSTNTWWDKGHRQCGQAVSGHKTKERDGKQGTRCCVSGDREGEGDARETPGARREEGRGWDGGAGWGMGMGPGREMGTGTGNGEWAGGRGRTRDARREA